MQGLGLGLGLTLAGSSGGGIVPSDDIPDAFTFTDVTGATVSTQYTSNTITVTGIDTASAISITGGTYSINGGGYTASAGSVVNGDQVSVRTTSSGSFSTAVNAALTIGGVSDTYTVTTTAADDVPSAFTFTDITNASTSTQYTSNTITVLGINTSSAITITGGTYSINGGSYTASAGTVVVNDTVSVRVTSSGSASTAVNVVLTIGGVSDTYTVTTAAAGQTAASIGQNSQASGVNNTLVITTGTTAPAGSVIVIAIGSDGASVSGVTDSGGNTYTIYAAETAGGGKRFYFYASYISGALNSGSTITTTFSSSSGIRDAAACYVTGAPSTGYQASHGTYTTATSTTPTSTTGTLAQANNVVIGTVRAINAGNDTITEDGTFTSLTPATLGGSNPKLFWAYRVTSATTSVTYAPTLPSSREWYADNIVIKAA